MRGRQWAVESVTIIAYDQHTGTRYELTYDGTAFDSVRHPITGESLIAVPADRVATDMGMRDWLNACE